jgi:hypothetical protein
MLQAQQYTFAIGSGYSATPLCDPPSLASPAQALASSPPHPTSSHTPCPSLRPQLQHPAELHLSALSNLPGGSTVAAAAAAAGGAPLSAAHALGAAGGLPAFPASAANGARSKRCRMLQHRSANAG